MNSLSTWQTPGTQSKRQTKNCCFAKWKIWKFAYPDTFECCRLSFGCLILDIVVPRLQNLCRLWSSSALRLHKFYYTKSNATTLSNHGWFLKNRFKRKWRNLSVKWDRYLETFKSSIQKKQWINEWANESKNGWVNEARDQKMDEWMSKGIKKWMNEWAKELKNGWMNEQNDDCRN